MKKAFSVASFAVLGCIAASSAIAAGSVARFDGGIGVHPVAGIAGGLPVLNTVLQVPPGGRPWVISRLKADIKADGSISAQGEGLLLAGGDTIGTVGPVNQVAATLFCGGQPFSSGAAALDASGNFNISGSLAVTPPSPCATPVLLIRNATGGTLGAWFAAGIPKDN